MVSGDTRDLGDVHIDELLKMTVQSGASDLHLSVNLPPMVRKDGKLVKLPFEKMQERDTQRIVFDVLNNSQIEKFERSHELDFSYGVKGIGRFRFNVYRQRSSVGCAMRVIPNVAPQHGAAQTARRHALLYAEARRPGSWSPARRVPANPPLSHL